MVRDTTTMCRHDLFSVAANHRECDIYEQTHTVTRGG